MKPCDVESAETTLNVLAFHLAEMTAYPISDEERIDAAVLVRLGMVSREMDELRKRLNKDNR